MPAPAGLAPFFNLTGSFLDPSSGEPLIGTVTFTPTVKALLVAGAPKPFTALPQPEVVQLDRDGDMAVDNVKIVPLVSTDDPATNPTGNWTYTVSFSLRTVHGKTVKYDSFSIVAPSGLTKDLTEVSQVSPGNGTLITVGPPNILSIGTVTTTEAGTPATADITGTSPEQVLDLTVPKGDQGIQGEPGDLVEAIGGLIATGTMTLTSEMFPSTRRYTMTGNTTFVLPTPGADESATMTLVLVQDATGNRVITWPSSATLKWPDGIVQQPAAAANSTSIFNLLWVGNYWYGLVAGKSFA